MDLKAMNIIDVLTPAASELTNLKLASLSIDTKNLEFAVLMGQSMQVQEVEIMQVLPNQEIMNFTIADADDTDNAVQAFSGNNERMFAGMQKNDLMAGNQQLGHVVQGIKEAEFPLFPAEDKSMPLVNYNQEDDSEIVENILQSKSGDKKRAITINVSDNVKLSSSGTVLNQKLSQLLPDDSKFVLKNDPHKHLTDYLKNLNAQEILINNKPQPQKVSAESAVFPLESDQMESLVRANIKRVNGGNSEVVSISNKSEKVSGEIVLPFGEENLTDSNSMKKQNEFVIEKEANVQKGIEQKSESPKFDSLFKTGSADSVEAGNSAKTNLSTLQQLTQLKTSTDGHMTEKVKIVLPENFKLNIKQKTQTIMIRIEPDYLGPARLELKMTNDLLSAKLIVETAQAKSILESSISQLKEKLAAADIKVENLEINVRSESHNSHMFDKEHEPWQNQKALRRFNQADDSLVNNELVAMNRSKHVMPQYVGAGGVNLLA